jgi:hypothetical protein
MASKNISLQGKETQVETRLLLALWDMGGAKQEVKKRQITKRIVTKGNKVADYQGIFDELEKKGAIAFSSKGLSLVSPKGLEVLSEGLKSADFRFEGSIVGSWAANALVKWISHINAALYSTHVQLNGVKSAYASDAGEAITSYEEFKEVVLKIYDHLNQDYNLNDLVQIYRIRRELGNRVSRDKFNKWLLQMQENDIFLLMAGEMPDITPDKREDSVTIPGAGLRYYAKRLS